MFGDDPLVTALGEECNLEARTCRAVVLWVFLPPPAELAEDPVEDVSLLLWLFWLDITGE
jgi:hypothetical protein